MRQLRIRPTPQRLLILLAVLATPAIVYSAFELYTRGDANYQLEKKKRLRATYFARPEIKEQALRSRDRLFSDRGMAIIRGATSVETFRVTNNFKEQRLEAFPPANIDGYPITAKGLKQGPEFASRLARCFLDGRFYDFVGSFCDFDPGVAFRTWMGDESVDFVICFRCHQIEIYVHDSSMHLVHEGSSNLGAPMEGRDILDDLVQQAFPSDPEIQSLREASSDD